jgi:uncharacterized protein
MGVKGLHDEGAKMVATGLLRSQSHALADETVTLMEARLSQLIEHSNPGRGKAVADLLQERFIPVMREHVPGFMKQAASVYSKHFTRADLDQLIAFYESPVGKKLFTAQGTILAEMSQVVRVWGQNLEAEVMQSLAPEFQKRGLAMPGPP